jgi:hypothetical protein
LQGAFARLTTRTHNFNNGAQASLPAVRRHPAGTYPRAAARGSVPNAFR